MQMETDNSEINSWKWEKIAMQMEIDNSEILEKQQSLREMSIFRVFLLNRAFPYSFQLESLKYARCFFKVRYIYWYIRRS